MMSSKVANVSMSHCSSHLTIGIEGEELPFSDHKLVSDPGPKTSSCRWDASQK